MVLVQVGVHHEVHRVGLHARGDQLLEPVGGQLVPERQRAAPLPLPTHGSTMIVRVGVRTTNACTRMAMLPASSAKSGTSQS